MNTGPSPSGSVVLRFCAEQFAGHDEPLIACAQFARRRLHGCKDSDLDPRWEDEQTRTWILLTVPRSALPPHDSSYFFDENGPASWCSVSRKPS